MERASATIPHPSTDPVHPIMIMIMMTHSIQTRSGSRSHLVRWNVSWWHGHDAVELILLFNEAFKLPHVTDSESDANVTH